MVRDSFAKQATRIEWITVSGRHNAYLALRYHCRFGYRNAEQVRMDGPQTRRNCTELNTLDAAAFDERDRILKVIVCILGTIRSEDTTWRHRFAVDCFYDAHLVGANFNQGHFAHDFFKWVFDEV